MCWHQYPWILGEGFCKLRALLSEMWVYILFLYQYQWNWVRHVNHIASCLCYLSSYTNRETVILVAIKLFIMHIAITDIRWEIIMDSFSYSSLFSSTKTQLKLKKFRQKYRLWNDESPLGIWSTKWDRNVIRITTFDNTLLKFCRRIQISKNSMWVS